MTLPISSAPPVSLMNEARVALNRRQFLACLSALGLGSTLMPDALTIAAQDADIVTIEMLEAAQKIAGVSFTREEQQAILHAPQRQQRLHGRVRLSAHRQSRDDAQPAIVFNPVPPGKVLPSGPRVLNRRPPDVTRGHRPTRRWRFSR